MTLAHDHTQGFILSQGWTQSGKQMRNPGCRLLDTGRSPIKKFPIKKPRGSTTNFLSQKKVTTADPQLAEK